MGILSNLTELVTSGVTWTINKVVSAGGIFVACFISLMTWVTGKLVGAITEALQPMIAGLPVLTQSFTGIGLWLFGLLVLPLLGPRFIGLGVRFLIRRLPVIG